MFIQLADEENVLQMYNRIVLSLKKGCCPDCVVCLEGDIVVLRGRRQRKTMSLVHSSVRSGQVDLTRVEGEWGCAEGMHVERSSMERYS